MPYESVNRRQAKAAKDIVANKYGLDIEDGGWYDLVNASTGAKYEVKSTHRKYADGTTGRFRIRKQEHSKLAASTARGTAWYVFVLFDSSDSVDSIARRKPSTVAKKIPQFRRKSRGVKEYQLPWPKVV